MKYFKTGLNTNDRVYGLSLVLSLVCLWFLGLFLYCEFVLPVFKLRLVNIESWLTGNERIKT